MSPFQEFRLWVRRGPAGERVAAAVATAVVLGLIGWLLVPGTDTPSTDVSLSAGTVTTQPGAASTTPTTTQVAGVASPPADSGAATPTGGAAVSSSGAAATTKGAAACAAPPGNAPGVSSTQIKVAVTLVQVVGPAGNTTFGIATPQQQQADYGAVFADVNAHGGVACHKIVAQFFTVNPADQNDLQQKCLDIAQAGPFAVLDAGAYAQYPIKSCFAQHHIPYFGGYLLTTAETAQFYPYLFNLGTADTVVHDTILGLKDRGFFGGDFKKLGFVYHDCDKHMIDSAFGWMHQAGLSDAQIVSYDVGCPATFGNPSDLAQAVLKFKSAGVTHVTTANFVGDFANFTTIAQQQGFKPKYGLPDDSLIAISAGNQHPDFGNIANALAVTTSRDAENTTPGMAPTAGTQRCDAIFKAHGQPSTYQQAPVAGNICDQLWMFQAAVEHAPAMQQNALAIGLQRTKSIDWSYPQGPNDFSADRTMTGGQFWRVAQFMPSCNCWQVVDKDFKPSYR